MVGRDLVLALPARAVRRRARRGSRFAILRRDGAFGPVSFALRAGEIVGLYGIVGAGRSELAEALFGLAPADGGEILIDGRGDADPLGRERRSGPASPWCPRTGIGWGLRRCCRFRPTCP